MITLNPFKMRKILKEIYNYSERYYKKKLPIGTIGKRYICEIIDKKKFNKGGKDES